jgi:DNA-binding transcriptional MerR regulator
MEKARQYPALGGETSRPDGLRALQAPQARYSIGEMGRLFGLTARALRFYEEKGLLEPEREGLLRHYSRRDYRRVQVIVRGRRAGLSLEQIQELLDLYDPADQGRRQMARSLEHLRERAAKLDEQRAHIAEQIADLERRADASASTPAPLRLAKAAI